MFPGGKQINDGGLAEKLKKASNRPMTKKERREQIISFVYSGLGSKDKRTKKEVEQSLKEQGLI